MNKLIFQKNLLRYSEIFINFCRIWTNVEGKKTLKSDKLYALAHDILELRFKRDSDSGNEGHAHMWRKRKIA